MNKSGRLEKYVRARDLRHPLPFDVLVIAAAADSTLHSPMILATL
jgi:hypothetical protein